MAIGAKAQAEPQVAPKSATNLANDIREESLNDYVGYRYLDLDPSRSVYTVKIEPVTLENIEPGDKLIPPSHLNSFRKVVTPDKFKKRARKTKWKIWRYSALCSVVPLGYATLLASEFAGVTSFFSSEAIGTALALSPLPVLLPMFSLLLMFLSDFLGQVDEGEVKEIPFLDMPEFRRLDGTPYDLNTPNYEEIYEALSLLNKVSTLSDSVEETKKAIEDLRMARKTAKTMSSQAELHETLDRLQNEIPVLEDRVAEILARKSDSLEESGDQA